MLKKLNPLSIVSYWYSMWESYLDFRDFKSKKIKYLTLINK